MWPCKEGIQLARTLGVHTGCASGMSRLAGEAAAAMKGGKQAHGALAALAASATSGGSVSARAFMRSAAPPMSMAAQAAMAQSRAATMVRA